MTSNQPTFQLSGIHTSQPVSLLVYAWNKKGRSEAVTAMEDVIIMADSRSQSPELPPSVVMKEPLFFVIGGAVLGFLVISLLSLIWYLKRRVSEAASHKLRVEWLLLPTRLSLHLLLLQLLDATTSLVLALSVTEGLFDSICKELYYEMKEDVRIFTTEIL